MQFQGRSHAFKTGEAQAAKIILGPFNLKKWRGQTLLLLYSEPKTGGAQALPAHSKTTPLINTWFVKYTQTLELQNVNYNMTQNVQTIS